jgi:adenylate cyclase
MGVDEIGTLRALKAIRRELADPAIAAHHGRVVKTTGDGILIEFASVVDAVVCAVAIQDGMVARNAAIPLNAAIGAWVASVLIAHGGFLNRKGILAVGASTDYH